MVRLGKGIYGRYGRKMDIMKYQFYESATIAQKITKCAHISMACKGLRKTAGGYHWEYVE